MFGPVSIEFYNIIIVEYALLLLYIFKASLRIYIRLYRQARMDKGLEMSYFLGTVIPIIF